MSRSDSWNDPFAPRIVQERNLRYGDISSLGFNCIKLIISLNSELLDIKDTIQKYGEDGKYGLRIHSPAKKIIPHNAAFVNASPVAYNRQSLQEIDKSKDFSTNLRFKSKEETLKHIDELIEWKKSVQHHDNMCRQVSNIELIVAHYRHKQCQNCKRPHYEHIVSNNSFHVCTYCGCVYKWSNIQHCSHLHLDDEGNLKRNLLPFNTPGETTEDPSPFVHHKIRALRIVKSMIGRLCDFLRCDEGDGGNYIRKWACNVLDRYEDIIKLRGRREIDFHGKMKMGRWHVACVFVWYAILFMEKRTRTTSKWSLPIICTQASELHKDNYDGPGKRKRNTRPFRLECVHKYALIIKKDMGDKWRNWCNFHIPDLRSIQCIRTKDVRHEINKYTQCIGKTMHYIYLPDKTPWDIDIVMEDNMVKIYPDSDKVGFKNGLRKGDILTHINKKPAENSIQAVYDQITHLKRQKCDKNIITLTILR